MFIAAVEVAGSRVWCSTFKDQGDGIRWRVQYVFPKSVGSLGKTRAVTLCDRLAGRKVLPIWFGAAPRCWDPKSRHLPGFEGIRFIKIHEIHVRYIYEIHEHTATVRLYVNMPLIDAIAHECLSLKHGQDVLQPHQLAVWRLWCDY